MSVKKIFLYGGVLVGTFLVIFFLTTFSTTGNSTVSFGSMNDSSDSLQIQDAPMQGNRSATVTMIEFSDFQCPYCRSYLIEAYPQIKEEYILTGKIKYYHKDFPLSFHPLAIPSAIAARCVREQGGDDAYFEYYEKVIHEQNILDGGSVKSTVRYSEKDLKKWAKEMGYDISSCLDRGTFKQEVLRNQREGAQLGISGTPTFFINGKKITGSQPYPVFKETIDLALANQVV